MTVASHIELRRLRAQVTERVNSIRGRKSGFGFLKTGETKEQACVRTGRDVALAERIRWFRWRTPQEQAAADRRATPDWLREGPSHPPLPPPPAVVTEPVADNEPPTDEDEASRYPYANCRIPYPIDWGIV